MSDKKDWRMSPEDIKRMQEKNRAENLAAASKTHEQIVESRLTAIAWFTGIVALAVVVGTIGTLVLVGQLT